MQKKTSRYKSSNRVMLAAALLFTAVLFRSADTGVSAYHDDSLEDDQNEGIQTIYHVNYGDERIGFTDNQEAVEKLIADKFEEAEEEYEDLSLTTYKDIDIIPERVFQVRTLNQVTLEKLEDEIHIKAEAVKVSVDGEKVGFADVGDDPSDVKRAVLSTIADEEAVDAYLEGEHETGSGSTTLEKVRFSGDIETERVLADPRDVLDEEELADLLMTGAAEEVEYEVQEGDVPGRIASTHEVSLASLIKLNDSLEDEDSFIHKGQKLTLEEPGPLLEVEVEMLVKETSEIPFDTETKEDSSLTEGTTEVEQAGTEGEKVEEKRIVIVNGEEVESETLDEETLTEPEKRIVLEGTASPNSGSLEWPAVGGYISSHKGMRWGRMHKGIDIARPSSHEIKAAHGGTVESAGYENGYGNTVRIKDGSGMETVYAHLESIDVNTGQSVSRGEEIGIMGETGTATGVHLHFEVYENGDLKDPMDYLDY
ncbi:M23 family metallopeptidase [Alteribacter natronophilus]|uniref:M23 family metallopeptidase n=1 Tax=Alteribacter natronophilus TaxID=2583810 RepID=UPI00110DBA3E|nr:M23 family metallopeptidase [Alteribacter natronophilus]TMW72028.1 M23 family metallopeptidase [Alteribacter natronophilus]